MLAIACQLLISSGSSVTTRKLFQLAYVLLIENPVAYQWHPLRDADVVWLLIATAAAIEGVE